MYKVLKKHIMHPVKMGWYNIQIAIGGAWPFFLKQQKGLSKKLLREYYYNARHEEQGCIVFQCDGHIYHFGLADRLKGICSLYTWCKANGRQFYINFVEPFLLNDYLVPNECDWRIDEVHYDADSQPCVCLMEPRTCGKPDVVKNHRQYLQNWMDDNLSIAGKQLHVYTNMNYATDEEFATAFSELFRPSDRLQSEIDKHTAVLGTDYISISFRFTTLLGDFEDCTGAPLPVEERQPLIDKCLAAVGEIRKKIEWQGVVLITADSPTFIEQVKDLPNVYVIPGEIGHIDYQHSDAVNMKTFLDFWLISKAKAVYLYRTGKMYNSAFAKTAAMAGGKPFEVVSD